MYSGPKLQVDLLPLLIRFRSYPYALSGDITKFFNQFKMQKNHQDFQRLVSRASPSLPLQHFRVTRVNFGVTAAPFLASRCLFQLFEDENCDLLLKRVITEETLVDNVLTGSFSLHEAIHIQQKLIEIMNNGKLHLRKWTSNVQELLDTVDPTSRATQLPLLISEGQHTLGLIWNPASDNFSLLLPKYKDDATPTKRKVLSYMAKLFDPAGWVTPVSIRAKIFLQELWKSKVEWDDLLSAPFQKKWKKYVDDLPALTQFGVPRCYTAHSLMPEDGSLPKFELVGFCDSSNNAYAAVAYIRTMYPNGTNSITLVGSKTKVAPVKGETTPRLELCGARLLSSFLKTILKSSRLVFEVIICYTDSTVVVGWLNQNSISQNKKEVFVVNRIRTIHNNIPTAQWKHVNGIDNPADSASRGISSANFLNSELWLNGPLWLTTTIYSPPICQVSVARVSPYPLVLELIMKTSSLVRMTRVIAYVKRYIHNLKYNVKHVGPLSKLELDSALLLLVHTVQAEVFHEDIFHLTKGFPVPKNIKFLAPFVDKCGSLRVGGRLAHADVNHEQKHPLLLPKKHHFTVALLRSYHVRYLHAGPTLLLTLIREKFWIPGGPTLAKRVVRECVICHRYSARPITQFMGDLPKPRVTLSRPFTHVGMDFAGPFPLNITSGRNPKSTKAYMCVFVCMAVKAVHLELVGDLSTPAFIAALHRFVSRRGRPKALYSDGGKNFIGAKNELDRVVEFLNAEGLKQKVSTFCIESGIEFNFNPPLAPHHGGLYEAVVKSAKYHLKRTIEDRHLTHEEFATLLCQVEALLNSRPLTSLSSDPSDFQALTPAHFLVGSSLFSVPYENLMEAKESRLNRWERSQKLYQLFATRFTKEYLYTLQTRQKWIDAQPNVKPGTLVLLCESSPNFISNKWNLARITRVFPGSDGKVRVVEVKTPSGSLLRRPIVRISPLPIQEN